MDGFGIRLDKMDQTFGELKQLLMGLQNAQSSGISTSNRDSTLSEETVMGSNSTPEVTHNLSLTPISIPTVLHNIVPFPMATPPVYTYSHTTTPQHLQHNPVLHLSFTTPQHPTFHSSPITPLTNPPPSHFNPSHFMPPPNTFTYQNPAPPPPFTGFIPPPSPHTTLPYQTFHINPKIEFLRFDGLDPKGWVSRAEQYFEFIPIDDLRRTKLAGLHFGGKASTWFRYYQSNKGIVNWKNFVFDIIARFENPETRDVQDLFNKLKQVTTVADYEDKFEELRAMVLTKNKGFTEEYYISSFISGLKDHIKNSVRMFRP